MNVLTPEIQSVMEKKNFSYSLKNIPIPTEDSYMKCMIEKVESLIRRMRWKAFFFDKDKKPEPDEFNTYGFNLEKRPPQINALIPFENDMYNMMNSNTQNVDPNSRNNYLMI